MTVKSASQSKLAATHFTGTSVAKQLQTLKVEFTGGMEECNGKVEKGREEEDPQQVKWN